MLTTIVVQTRSPDCILEQSGKSWKVHFQLPKPLVFDEPHVARLLGVSGTSDIVLVYANFVAHSPFNSGQKQFLGIVSTRSRTSWVPLATDQISNICQLVFETAKGGPITNHDASNSTFVIEIAPASSILGPCPQWKSQLDD